LSKRKHGDALLSIYVRGSISTGKAYLHSSDVDMVIVLKGEVDKKHIERWVILTAQDLLERYDVVSDVDLTTLSVDRFLHDQEYARLRVYIATRSALLWGQDIARSLPRFRPDRNLARYMYPNIESEIESLREIFSGRVDPPPYLGRKRSIRFWCIWTMRTVLRSAQALAMCSTNIYETDLNLCLENTTVVYPSLRPYLEQAYEWALSPVDDTRLVLCFLDDYLPKFLQLWQYEVPS